MDSRVRGFHHITAIAGDAQRNYEFYTRVLGLRLVKKTVNFDDPGTYHFYFGDEQGTPGTILTFFPWAGVKAGRNGAGMATDIGYAVPNGSIPFWKKRLEMNGIKITGIGSRFGEEYLSFEDPDGLPITFVMPAMPDQRTPWTTADVSQDVAIRGFHSITLTLNNTYETARVLKDIFEYAFMGQEGSRHRYTTNAVDNAATVDLIDAPSEAPGVNAGGTVHHVAFRVTDEETLMAFRERIVKKGFHITPKIDRNYFFSLYFREPGGVLFELATDNPGFTVDEPLGELGQALKLPPQYESQREKIQKVLPSLA